LAALQVKHGEAVAHAERNRALMALGDGFHVGLCGLADALACEHRVAKGEHRKPEPQPILIGRLHQESKLGHGVAQSPDGGLRQAGHARKLTRSQLRRCGREALQDVETAPESRNELTVGLARRLLFLWPARS
jgi:hypothetical protein